MSDDERRDEPSEGPGGEASDSDRSREEQDESGLDTSESSGIGLTEEFARIEAEIEGDRAPAGAEGEQPGPDETAGSGAPDADDAETEAEDWVFADGEVDEALEAADDEADPAEVGEQAAAETDPETELVPGTDAEAELVPGTDAEAESVAEPVALEGAGDEPEANGDSDAAAAGAAAAGSEAGTEATQPEDAVAEGEDAAAEGEGATSDGEDAAAEGEEATSEGEDAAAEGAGDAAEDPTEVAPVPVSAAAQRVGQHPVVRPMPRPIGAVAAGIPDGGPEDKTPSLWWRFLFGSVLIIVSIAASVSVAGLLFLSDVAAKLKPIPGVQKQLDAVGSDDPQTILIVGSDKRSDAPKGAKGLSDTTMLLRVDPESDVLSLFSLPRDLKVDIPGVGVAKLNEAYSAGGSKKTLETVKAFTGVEINHIVEINFQAFADAVNAVGCVYIDVDRDYFHSNEGLPASEHYSEIDINAGYQRLCGLKALQFVRFRHTDTDLVRAARQQDFLREARQKVQPNELLPVFGGTGNELIDIFTDNVDSDINDEADVIGILKSFIAVRNVPVNEVHFQGDIGGPTDPFVTSTDDQVEKAIDEFYTGGGSSGLRGGEKANKKGKQKQDKKKDKKKAKDEKQEANVIEADPQFAKYAATADRRLNFPVFYPTKLAPGSEFSRDSRTYEYDNEDDGREAAYKFVISLTDPSTLIEYYGVMGTTWNDPPILRNPSEVRKIDGRDYLLFYDGGRLRMVGWRQKGNSYWLNNTLVQSIGEAEMLEIATTMKEL